MGGNSPASSAAALEETFAAAPDALDASNRATPVSTLTESLTTLRKLPLALGQGFQAPLEF